MMAHLSAAMLILFSIAHASLASENKIAAIRDDFSAIKSLYGKFRISHFGWSCHDRGTLLYATDAASNVSGLYLFRLIDRGAISMHLVALDFEPDAAVPLCIPDRPLVVYTASKNGRLITHIYSLDSGVILESHDGSYKLSIGSMERAQSTGESYIVLYGIIGNDGGAQENKIKSQGRLFIDQLERLAGKKVVDASGLIRPSFKSALFLSDTYAFAEVDVGKSVGVKMDWHQNGARLKIIESDFRNSSYTATVREVKKIVDFDNRIGRTTSLLRFNSADISEGMTTAGWDSDAMYTVIGIDNAHVLLACVVVDARCVRRIIDNRVNCVGEYCKKGNDYGRILVSSNAVCLEFVLSMVRQMTVPQLKTEGYDNTRPLAVPCFHRDNMSAQATSQYGYGVSGKGQSVWSLRQMTREIRYLIEYAVTSIPHFKTVYPDGTVLDQTKNTEFYNVRAAWIESRQ